MLSKEQNKTATGPKAYICQDYADGKEVPELARTYGLSSRRITQILNAAGITRRKPKRRDKQALSKVHVRIGLHLYQFRKDKGVDLMDASNDLDPSSIKIRRIEKGTSELELLDLLNIAAYMELNLPDLFDRGQ
jgi:hypothetical protein